MPKRLIALRPARLGDAQLARTVAISILAPARHTGTGAFRDENGGGEPAARFRLPSKLGRSGPIEVGDRPPDLGLGVHHRKGP